LGWVRCKTSSGGDDEFALDTKLIWLGIRGCSAGSEPQAVRPGSSSCLLVTNYVSTL
jgi:hypothetical protein